VHKFTILFLCLGLVATVFTASTQQNSEAVQAPTAIETVWGPDAFGYIARDSNEPGGPPVDWIDISGIGTAVSGLGDDNIVGPYNVGFPFRFYWYDVTSFYVGSNGYLRFSGTGQLSSSFTFIPNPVPPNDLICFYTADFDPSSGGTVYYWTNNTDTVIVSFVGVPAWNTPTVTGSFDFQVVLSAVDSSITFNYGTLTGPFYDTSGMVGIENNAGNIGIFNYPTNVVPQNYSIKFYYPSVILLDVHDIAVTRVQNNNSGGFFVETGNSFQTNATVKNAGNQDESNFYVIGEVRQYPSNTLVYEDSFLVANLNAGETQEIDFPEMFTMNTAGYYYVRVRSTLSGDMVASNDQIDVEMHVVDLPGELALDDGTSDQIWSWAGGTGGMGIYYLPPVYPVKITEIKAYLGAGTLPVLLQLYDDDGPGGEPGTMLTSIPVNATVENWYTISITDSNLVINDGGVYVVYMMTGNGSSGIGLDQTTLGSRQTWEYTGVWAVFRNFETDDAMLRLSVEQQGQIVFSDDFENGLGNWTGDWALTTATYNSPTHSYTDSPGGNYPANANLIGAMASGVDLSSFLGATLEFYTKYELETGFDYCYLEVSTDGGTNWIRVKTYNGEGVVTQFTQETVDIGAFAGQSDVRFRFRLVSDGGYETDGMYVDDFSIMGSYVDSSPPLLQYTPPANYEGVIDTFHFPIVITDLSGVNTATLSYWLDNNLPAMITIDPANVSNDTFYFDIPTVESGSLVKYFVYAEDGASPANSITSDTMAYIAGSPVIYDDGDPEYITNIAAGAGCAVRFDAPPANTPRLTTGLLRIYTDSNRPIDSVTVHIWEDNSGVPGADLITPYKIYPSCTLAEPQAWTIVDLRSFNLEPTTGYWIGFMNTSGIDIWYLYDSPAVNNRTSTYSSGVWTAFAGDFHTRAVLGSPVVGINPGVIDLIPDEFALYQNYPNPFNPTTTIKYGLKNSVDVKLTIYNLVGQEVRTLVNNRQDAGYKTVVWDGLNNRDSRVASGIYIYRLQAGDFVQARKMILMK